MSLATGETVQNGVAVDADSRIITTTDTVADGGAAPIKFAVISKAATGDLVALVTAKKIRVLGYTLVSAGIVNVNFESGTDDISGVVPLVANSGVSYAGGRDAPAFETASGVKLAITLSAAIQVSGHLSYIEV